MAKARRTVRSRSGTSPRRRISRDLARVFTPEVVRSIVGTAMMALGAITLIALDPAGPGRPDRLVA